MFLRESKSFSVRDRNEISRKKFGVLGDCVFLTNVDNYSSFLNDFLKRFDYGKLSFGEDLSGVVRIESGFRGSVYLCSINGVGFFEWYG